MKNINEMLVEVMQSKDFSAEDFSKTICNNIYDSLGSCENDCPFCVKGFYTSCARQAFIEMCNRMKEMNPDSIKEKSE